MGSATFEVEDIPSSTLEDKDRLVSYLREKYNLSERPERRITIQKDGTTVTAIPVVDLSGQKSFHRLEAGLSLSARGVVGCLVTLDERTAITKAIFLYVRAGQVIESDPVLPSHFDLSGYSPQLRITRAGNVSGTASYILHALSSDSEARAVHPQLKHSELFSADNSAFLETLHAHGASLRENALALTQPELALPCCTCTCTTGCSCCAVAASFSDSQAGSTEVMPLGELEDVLVSQFIRPSCL